MQKKLIALAIAGLSSAAFAQSNVTISGQLKGGYQSYKVQNSGTAANNGSQNLITDETSSFVLSGSEALGNGLSAIFRIDNRFTLDAHTGNNALATGNTHVGLKSATFGEIKLGTQDLHYNEIERIENGAKSLSQQAMAGRGILNKVDAQNVGAGQTRTKNVVFWDSPNWSGFTARLAYSTAPIGAEGGNSSAGNNSTVNDGGSAWNAVGRYENGPIKAGISHYKQTSELAAKGAIGTAQNTTTDQSSTRAWGAYKIAGFSLGLAYDTSKIEGAAGEMMKRTAWAVPVSYTTGNHGVYVTYAKASDLKEETGKLGNSGAKQWTIGYDYSLSKRTSVGVNYTQLSNEANGNYTFANLSGASGKGAVNGGAGADYKQLYAGVRHAF